MALDVNFQTVVDRLEDINWVRHWEGVCQIRQPWPPIILSNWRSWAVVLIAQQDWRSRKAGWDPLRFVLTHWRHHMGAWRIQDYFRISERAVRQLAESFGGTDLMDKIHENANRWDKN